MWALWSGALLFIIVVSLGHGSGAGGSWLVMVGSCFTSVLCFSSGIVGRATGFLQLGGLLVVGAGFLVLVVGLLVLGVVLEAWVGYGVPDVGVFLGYFINVTVYYDFTLQGTWCSLGRDLEMGGQ